MSSPITKKAMTAQLEAFFKLLQEMESEYVSKSEIMAVLKALRSVVENTKQEVLAAKTDLSDRGEKQLVAVEKKLTETIKEVEKLANRMQDLSRSDSRLTMRMFEEKVEEMKKMIPEGYDDSELRERISDVVSMIPTVHKPFDPAEIYEELEEIEKEIEELKARPVGSGGGVTNARIIQAFKYILKTETPSGAINGVNTQYTVTQPIFAVLAFSLNGEVIAELPNYTISGRTITFSTALPAAYSGRDFEIKYV